MTLYEFLGIDISDPSERSAVEMEEWRRSIMSDLVAIRKEKKMRISEVAREMMISRQAVRNIEKGHRDPRLSTLIRYAIAVGAHLNMTADTVENVYPVPATDSVKLSFSVGSQVDEASPPLAPYVSSELFGSGIDFKSLNAIQGEVEEAEYV